MALVQWVNHWCEKDNTVYKAVYFLNIGPEVPGLEQIENKLRHKFAL